MNTKARPARRRVLAVALAVLAAALSAVAISSAAPTTIRSGNLILTVNGGVTPKALSKTTMEPIALNVEGRFTTADGSRPPAIKEILVDTDKAGSVDARGVPTCKPAQLEARASAQAKAACETALIGTGTTDVTVAFPEQNPILIHSELLAFNGGIKGGVTTIFIHAFLTNPIAAAIVTTVKVSKEHKGPYGTHSIASIPRLANGAGSVTAFNLTFPKKLFAYKGTKHGYLLAKCNDGSFVAQAEASFLDGTKLGPAKITRPCTPKAH